MSHDNPCRFCEKREVGCYGKCPDYKAFRQELDEKNERRRQEKLIAKEADDFLINEKAKRIKNARKRH